MQPPPGKPRVPPPPPGGAAGLPPPPNRPVQPGPARTPAATQAPFYGQPVPAAAPGWTGEMSPALAAQAMQMPKLRKRPNLGFLRFFAGACVTTAWLNVVLTVLLTIGAFGAGASLKAMTGMLLPAGGSSPGLSQPGLPQPGLGTEDPFSTSPGGASTPQTGMREFQEALLQGFTDRLTTLFVIGGFLNILFGICVWIFFIGLAKLTYGYIDLEEQAGRDHDAVQVLLANMGAR